MSRRFGAVPTGETIYGLVGLYVNPQADKIWEPDKSGDAWAVVGPFVGKINGSPTAINVPYDTDTAEDSISPFMVLHNTTLGEKVRVTDINVATNAIAVEADSPDDASTWNNNDDLTTKSQTNTGRTNGFADFDVTSLITNTFTGGMFFQATLAANVANSQGTMIIHPYEAYSQGKETFNLKLLGALPAFGYNAATGLTKIVWEGGRAYFTMGVFFEANQVAGLITFLAEG